MREIWRTVRLTRPMVTRENIVLIGFMGTGKSSLGRRVAKELGFAFRDTDQLIVQREKREIAEIFAEDGEEYFRAAETRALESLAGLQRCVLATGGGVVVKEENHPLLRALGLVVCLTASEETLFARVSRNRRRPLLQTENPRATLAALLAQRRLLYERAAQVTIDTTECSPSAAVAVVVNAARQAFAAPLSA